MLVLVIDFHTVPTSSPERAMEFQQAQKETKKCKEMELKIQKNMKKCIWHSTPGLFKMGGTKCLQDRSMKDDKSDSGTACALSAIMLQTKSIGCTNTATSISLVTLTCLVQLFLIFLQRVSARGWWSTIIPKHTVLRGFTIHSLKKK